LPGKTDFKIAQQAAADFGRHLRLFAAQFDFAKTGASL